MVCYMKEYFILQSCIILETGCVFVFKGNSGETPVELDLREEPQSVPGQYRLSSN
jgi:hypothetical protein